MSLWHSGTPPVLNTEMAQTGIPMAARSLYVLLVEPIEVLGQGAWEGAMLALMGVWGHYLEGELEIAGGGQELATLRTRRKPNVMGCMTCKRGTKPRSPQMSFFFFP